MGTQKQEKRDTQTKKILKTRKNARDQLKSGEKWEIANKKISIHLNTQKAELQARKENGPQNNNDIRKSL